MAIYTNETLSGGSHGIFQSSLLRSTLAGHIWDCLVVSESGSAPNITRTPIDVDNGVAVKVGDFTGNGLQERYATIAAVGDKIGVVGSPAIVKDAVIKSQEDETYFYVKAGKDAKVYQVEVDGADCDIFGVGLHQFTDASLAKVAVNNYVVVSGDGKWVATDSAPSTSTYGFIGKIHSIHTGMFYSVVRIAVLQNTDV